MIMINEADILHYDFVVNGITINRIKGVKYVADLKVECFLSINDGKKRQVFQIIKSKLNFKTLLNEDIEDWN